jgi:hypothetical protein
MASRSALFDFMLESFEPLDDAVHAFKCVFSLML